MHRYAGPAAPGQSDDALPVSKSGFVEGRYGMVYSEVASVTDLQAVPVSAIWNARDMFGSFRGLLMLALVLWGLVVLFVGTITTAMGL